MKSKSLLKRLFSFLFAVITFLLCFPVMEIDASADDGAKITVLPDIKSYYFARMTWQDNLAYFTKTISDYNGPSNTKDCAMDALYTYDSSWDRNKYGALFLYNASDGSGRFLGNDNHDTYSFATYEKATSIFRDVNYSTKAANTPNFYSLSLEHLPVLEHVDCVNVWDGMTNHGSYQSVYWRNLGYSFITTQLTNKWHHRYTIRLRGESITLARNEYYYEFDYDTDDPKLNPCEGSTYRTWYFILFKSNTADGRCMISHDINGNSFTEWGTYNVGVGHPLDDTPRYPIAFCLWFAYEQNGYASGTESGTYQVEKGNTVNTTTPYSIIKKGSTLNVYGDLIINNEFHVAGTLNVYGNVIVTDGGKLYTSYYDDIGNINVYENGSFTVRGDSFIQVDKLNSSDTNGCVTICGGTFSVLSTLKTNYVNDGQTASAYFVKFTDSTSGKPGLFFFGPGANFYRPNGQCPRSLSGNYSSMGAGTVNNVRTINTYSLKSTR